jgi:site-specific DNA-methyltransferase (adenine-specific)
MMGCGMSDVRVLHGDCVELMRGMPDCSVDAIVTDPPYELSFMGRRWDASGIAYSREMWGEALRVLKPGGHLLAFGGTRTYHRMACAIEDAGFEIRDSIHWVYGSGFPKSLNIGKAIDKAAGAEREVVGERKQRGRPKAHDDEFQKNTSSSPVELLTASATEEAARWEGWGTALKPAHEPIVVARKPLAGTVAGNVLQWGTGGLNIDGCRVGTDGGTFNSREALPSPNGIYGDGLTGGKTLTLNAGRWPANVVFDRTAGQALDQQSGEVGSLVTGKTGNRRGGNSKHSVGLNGPKNAPDGYGDSGGASRFFTQADFGPDDWPFVYQAKPSRKERNAGLHGLPEQQIRRHSGGEYAHNSGSTESSKNGGSSNNHHPTVKPVALMRHLVRLVTPPGGTVLDPFAGSGTTLVAAILEGFNAVGCEMTDEYLPIIAGRVEWAHERAFLFDELAKAAPQQPTLL